MLKVRSRTVVANIRREPVAPESFAPMPSTANGSGGRTTPEAAGSQGLEPHRFTLAVEPSGAKTLRSHGSRRYCKRRSRSDLDIVLGSGGASWKTNQPGALI